MIEKAPKVGLLKVERPEIHVWSIDEYRRLMQAALECDRRWYAAVCLAGEAGLRIGEVAYLATQLRDPLGDVRGEPLEADVLDGPQAG